MRENIHRDIVYGNNGPNSSYWVFLPANDLQFLLLNRLYFPLLIFGLALDFYDQ